ncbi:MAG: tetratricopeptide repeat protein [Brevinema sp.]
MKKERSFAKPLLFGGIFVLGLIFGVMIGRSFDSVDLAMRKAQEINRKAGTAGSLRVGGSWNLFGLFSPYKTLEDEVRANPKKQKEYFENITNKIEKKHESITVLKDAKELIKLAKQEVLIDHSLHIYLYGLGLLELQNGMVFQSIEHLEEAYHIMPRDISTKQSLATAYIALYRTKTDDSEKKAISEKIIHYSLLALEDNPKHLDTLYGLGLVYTDLKQFDKAEQYFEEVLVFSPENINAMLGLGRIYFEQNQLTKSKNIYEKSEALILEQISRKKFLRKSLNHDYELNRKLTVIRNNLKIIYELLEE